MSFRLLWRCKDEVRRKTGFSEKSERAVSNEAGREDECIPPSHIQVGNRCGYPSSENLKYLSDLYSVSLDYLLSDSADAPEQNRRISNEPDGEMVTISDSADGGKKGKQKTAKWLAILMVVVALITVIVITYLNQKETEPIEQNTVKFEELQKDERISDSNAVESGPVS